MLRYLADTSALARYGRPTAGEVLRSRIARGLVGVCVATELELGYSTRSPAEFARHRAFLDATSRVACTPRAEYHAIEIQQELARAGTHRAVSAAGLLIASIADVERLTVLHYDADFELIASVTGQRTEWIAPRGSID